MKILCFIHGYPPDHNAGAEWMLHAINKEMVAKGHNVRVMLRTGDIPVSKNGVTYYKKVSDLKVFEGVEIYREGAGMYSKLYGWADIIVTHLNMTGKAMNLARDFKKPLVHLLHNTHHNDVIYRINVKNNYLVYNAKWNKKASKYRNESIVVYPAVWKEDYEVEPQGDNITLVNCWADKGGHTLVELAKEMPEYKFLGVMGGYGDQVIGKEDNLTYIENTPNIKEVYKKSRIILMPSFYESWGRVAVEAMCSGIPVIAHPTPGLKESLGKAGLFADRDKPEQWVKLIKKLDNEDYYKEISDKCKKRANELNDISKSQMDDYEKFFNKIIKKGYEAV